MSYHGVMNNILLEIHSNAPNSSEKFLTKCPHSGPNLRSHCLYVNKRLNVISLHALFIWLFHWLSYAQSFLHYKSASSYIQSWVQKLSLVTSEQWHHSQYRLGVYFYRHHVLMYCILIRHQTKTTLNTVQFSVKAWHRGPWTENTSHWTPLNSEATIGIT